MHYLGHFFNKQPFSRPSKYHRDVTNPLILHSPQPKCRFTFIYDLSQILAYCFRKVDDTIIWHHGSEFLQQLVTQLNSYHPNIRFTIEVEKYEKFLFLNISVSYGANGSLRHTFFIGLHTSPSL